MTLFFPLPTHQYIIPESSVKMTDIDEILALYEPKDGECDSWTNSIIVPDREELLTHLGEESPVYVAIKQAGEDFLRARMIVRELIENGTTSRDTIPDNLADEVCEAMSCYARSPPSRFFNSRFVAHNVVVECFTKRGVNEGGDSELQWTDAHYNVVVTSAFWFQFMAMVLEDEEIWPNVISSMESCLKARPNDARVHVMFGNWLMVHGFANDGREHLEKALGIDEEGCFGAHYTLANVLTNIVPDASRVNQLAPFDRIRARGMKEGTKRHLERYLDLAPTGHWHIHRAAVILIHTNCELTARGSENIQSIEQRKPGFAAEQIALFDRCIAALRVHAKCYGREARDFKSMYKTAASIVASFHKLGLAGDSEMPECEYICANQSCTVCVKSNTLKACERCQSVRYCSKACQKKHWKQHKKDCKKLKKEYEEKKRGPKIRNCDVDLKQIGDEPSESEMGSLFED